MRPACGVALTARRRATYHQLRFSGEVVACADELRDSLLAVSRAAPYGKRCERVRQIEKNLQKQLNCAPETFLEILFSAQDNGVETELCLSVPETLATLLRARSPSTQQLSMRELHQVETELESELNPLQMAYITGAATTAMKRMMLEKFKKYRLLLDGLIERLEKELYPNGGQQ